MDASFAENCVTNWVLKFLVSTIYRLVYALNRTSKLWCCWLSKNGYYTVVFAIELTKMRLQTTQTNDAWGSFLLNICGEGNNWLVHLTLLHDSKKAKS